MRRRKKELFKENFEKNLKIMREYEDFHEEKEKIFIEKMKKHKKMNPIMRHRMMHRRLNELYFLNRYMHIFKRITLVITLVIILFMYKIIGFKVATIIITLILIVNEGTIIYMISRLEKRFIAPMGKLQKGVKKISQGDYSVRLEEDIENEIGILTREFNKMAIKLEESERIKKEYENNRKELITNISHDLKTPITSINGYVEALIEDVVPEEKVNNYLKTIRSNASYMNKLIDDLFLFSKLDMQKLDFKFIRTNIKYYLYDMVEEFGFILQEKGIKFSYDDEIENDIFVKLDGKRLYRSIRNLIDNAIKYGGDKEDLKVKIRMYEKDSFVYIEIIDNGPGIERDKIKNIFNRFYRIDKERTKDLSSTGLGLAIAKEIIEAHGGIIYADSELGLGSKFTIKMPILTKERDNKDES